MIISVRAIPNGYIKGIGIDGDWSQTRIKSALPDVLNTIPYRDRSQASDTVLQSDAKKAKNAASSKHVDKGVFRVKTRGPNTLTITSLDDVVSVYRVISYTTQPDDGHVIRNYEIGERIR